MSYENNDVWPKHLPEMKEEEKYIWLYKYIILSTKTKKRVFDFGIIILLWAQ